MKRMFLLYLLLSTLSCTHYFVRDSSQYELTNEELEFLRSKKIGLIGFYPFDYMYKRMDSFSEADLKNIQIENEFHLKMIRFVNDNPSKKEILPESKSSFTWFTYRKGGTFKTATVLDKDTNLIPLLGFGDPINSLRSNGENKSISMSNLKQFLSEYLLKTKHLGLEVVEPLIVTSKTNSNKEAKIQMKNFDVDYWVVAYHGPSQKYDPGYHISTASIYPYILTLGIFPMILNNESESTFFVFDKNLNLIKQFDYHDYFFSATSWLFFTDRFTNPPSIIYEPDIKQFSKELVQVLKK